MIFQWFTDTNTFGFLIQCFEWWPYKMANAPCASMSH